MKRGALVVTVSLGLMGLLFAPATALARRPHGGPGGSQGRIAVGGRPSSSHHHGFRHHHRHQHHHGLHHSFRHHHHGFRHHHHGFRPFFPWGVVTVYAPPVYFGAPAYYPPPVYYPPAYAPSAVYSPPVGGAPVTPSVIQYPHGRYELRGDGLTTPYTWVWIPNPPPPPPSTPPSPAAPPAAPPVSGDPMRPARHQLYRWIDDQGVVHWTDRSEAVPPQYRTQTNDQPSASPDQAALD
jgi:Domain of unknown function (DUF4124)